MTKRDWAAIAADHETHIAIEDEAELTAKELVQERKAAMEERQRLTWLHHSAEQLAGRIPVSVFAMGDLVGSS